MIPHWKIKREMQRLGQQLRALPEAIWEPLAGYLHNRRVAAGLPTTQGNQALQSKVAMVLIYQPAGLAESLLRLCRHLAGSGYAVLAVSNAPLSQKDRIRLAGEVWRIIERPNFGYDFGGYRDGWLHLVNIKVQPQRLVIVNDSIWFPLSDIDDTLNQMETAAYDITGTILRERGAERFLESYLYSIGPGALAHPAFRAFWQNYRLTSNKYKVIRRGERGFGQAMRAAGLTLGGLYPPAEFQRRIATAPEAVLRQVLAYTASADQPFVSEARALSRLQGAGWVESARSFIAKALNQGQFYSLFPVGAVQLMGYPVMKKSQEPVSAEWRAAYLAAVMDGILPAPPPPLLTEMMAATRRVVE